MEKRQARARIHRAVGALTREERADKSGRIHDRLAALPEMAAARSVMLFLSMDDEVDTTPIVRTCLAAGKAVYSPRSVLASRVLVPLRVRGVDDLVTGVYGIREPDTQETCRPEDLDLVLVPARAFDRAGNRLGRGAGFYDRFMASPGFRAVRVGVAFACQLVEAVPHDAHDLPVHVIVTEDEVVRAREAADDRR